MDYLDASETFYQRVFKEIFDFVFSLFNTNHEDPDSPGRKTCLHGAFLLTSLCNPGWSIQHIPVYPGDEWTFGR